MLSIETVIMKINSPRISKYIYPLILLIMLIISAVVYSAGGTITVLCHLMYIPIIASAIMFNPSKTILFALFATIALGPAMPLNVSEGIMQHPSNWIARGLFFEGIGIFAALSFKHIKLVNIAERTRFYENAITKLPNINKFKSDLFHIIKDNNISNISIFVLKFENSDEIIRYVNYDIAKDALMELLQNAKTFFNRYEIYSIYTNEFAVILPGITIEESYTECSNFLDNLGKTINVDGIPIHLELYGGIINYPSHGIEVNKLTQKLGRAISQAKKSNCHLSVYSQKLSERQSKKIKTITALTKAIDNDELRLVYQPKIDYRNNSVYGFEALLRWENEENLNIEEVIKIAEDIGFIGEITRWVINTAVKQLKSWQSKGLNFNVSVNISANDLNDNTIIDFTRECLSEHGIDPSRMEFEITERTFIDNEANALDLIKEIKSTGLLLSIDDYGTGYNSLKNLVTYPFDYIKIDKYFIDIMTEDKKATLLKNIFHSLQSMDLSIIAEGVETKEQADKLLEMGCDLIQGYYFSEPLSVNEIELFMSNFNSCHKQ